MDVTLTMSADTFDGFCQSILGGNWSGVNDYTAHFVENTAVSTSLRRSTLLDALHSVQLSISYLDAPNQPIKKLLKTQNIVLDDFERTDISKVLFVEAVFQLMAENDLFDEQVCLALFQLKVVYMSLLVQDSTLLNAPDKFAVIFINTMISQSAGWYRNTSKNRWQAKRGELLSFIRTVMSESDITEELMNHAMTEMLENIKQKNNKILRLERRLCEAEKGRIKLQDYDEQVADCINFNIRELNLSNVFIGFLHGTWREVLRGVLLQARDEDTGKAWRNAAQVTSLMIRSLQPKAYLKRFYSRADDIVERVEEIMESVNAEQSVIQSVADMLLNCQKEMIKESVNYETPPLIPLGKYFLNSEFSISNDLMSNLDGLDLNQHFCYREEDALPVLYKLIYIDKEHQFFFFTGMESCQHWIKSFKEIAFNLSSGMLAPIELDSAFPDYVDQVLDHWWSSQMKSVQADRENKFEEKKVAAIKKDKTDRAELELKIAEVTRLRKEYGDKLRTSSELRKKIKRIVDSLPLGAWIIISPGDNPCRGKLAVRIARSDKFIFVNRSGLRVAEYKRGELLEEIINGNVELEHEGLDFERNLSHIIQRIK